MSEHNLPKLIEVSKISTVQSKPESTYTFTMQKSESSFKTLGKFIIGTFQELVGFVFFSLLLGFSLTYGAALQALPFYLYYKVFSSAPAPSIPEDTKIWIESGQINFQVQLLECNEPARTLKVAVAKKSLNDVKQKLEIRNVNYKSEGFFDAQLKEDSLFIMFIKQVAPTKEEFSSKESDGKTGSCKLTYSYPLDRYDNIINQTSQGIFEQVSENIINPEI